MRERLARRGIAVGADIGFGEDVAGRRAGERLGDVDADRRRGQAVQAVIGESLAKVVWVEKLLL